VLFVLRWRKTMELEIGHRRLEQKLEDKGGGLIQGG
jgi:hypothetical protein